MLRVLSPGLALLVLTTAAAAPLDAARDDVSRFIDDMSERHGFDRSSLERTFATVESRQPILDAISRPAERVIPWHEYRDRFLTERRILKGVDFWQRHATALAEVQGAAPAIIVGILGVETQFGEMTGRFRVIDALATLAFDYPPRSRYFRGELEQFLLLTREEAVDPLRAVGSYAGAMGAPQFMPTSYRVFAVDADGDGKRDLWDSWSDVIGSVANYLMQHGWRANEPVVVPAALPSADLTRFDTSRLALNETVASLREKGVVFDSSMPDDAPTMLVVGEGGNGPEYRVGFNNFYVITRYNRSTMYAMAVHDLGQAITRVMSDAVR